MIIIYKVHQSWIDLSPNEYEKDFRFEDYYNRISKIDKYKNIPKLVFEQWIYPHHQNDYTLYNYAWIDYSKIEFRVCEWEFEKFHNVNVIKAYRSLFLERSKCIDFDQFSLDDEEKQFWKDFGTWRIPPIIIDLNSLTPDFHKWSELKPPFQLVEGHIRFGYIHSMKKISDLNKGKLASKHKLFLMIEKNTKDR